MRKDAGAQIDAGKNSQEVQTALDRLVEKRGPEYSLVGTLQMS